MQRLEDGMMRQGLGTEMVDRGPTQVPEFSRVEVKGKMHAFVSMDKSHPQREVKEMLYQMEWQLHFGSGYFHPKK